MKTKLFLVVDSKDHAVGLLQAMSFSNAKIIFKRLKKERNDLKGCKVYVVKQGKRKKS